MLSSRTYALCLGKMAMRITLSRARVNSWSMRRVHEKQFRSIVAFARATSLANLALVCFSSTKKYIQNCLCDSSDAYLLFVD